MLQHNLRHPSTAHPHSRSINNLFNPYNLFNHPYNLFNPFSLYNPYNLFNQYSHALSLSNHLYSRCNLFNPYSPLYSLFNLPYSLFSHLYITTANVFVVVQ